MNAFMIITLTALLMEPITALTHRIIMHKTLWIWHKSHHERFGKSFELNDYFPVVFSGLAIVLFIIGMQNEFIRYIAIGITLYGSIYFVVHELIIHSRFFKIKNNNRLFEYWRFSHNVHHQFHREPYGFIIPITPKDLSRKAKENPRNLIDRFHKKPSETV